eukprot:TRINITY_DN7760_c0_g1_i1.p1 TRINITY_DN7760_c0_g1~~TRINITY_DN7760_c0_g1_i1.p1  ORF type:complete len:481 (+),score=74.24 TRINITY_DN7760_c0_g1_i1:190-1443(+)
MYVKGKGLCEAFNEIVDRCSRDAGFLEKELGGTGAADEFTGRLLKLYKEVYSGGEARQKLMLGIHRSDYMLDTTTPAPDGTPSLKQIEINTIASAFAGLSPITNRFHNYLSTNVGARPRGEGEIEISVSDIEVPFAMATAALKSGVPDPVALFVVQDGEKNSCDQRVLEQKLWESHGILTIRKSLGQIHEEAVLSDEGVLSIGGKGVGLVYFRAGYTPNDYKDEKCWEARKLMEVSTAVKCPSVGYQLVGAKKIQQVLANREVLSKFCPPSAIDEVMSVFAEMSGLEDLPSQNAAIQRAVATPADWLLKPQREGGGSLIHSDAMVALLSDLKPSQRDEFILMKKIRPPAVPSAVLRNGAILTDSFISELGIYGAYLGDGETVEINKFAGHLLRSKPEYQPDGGVAAGVAALDSPALC